MIKKIILLAITTIAIALTGCSATETLKNPSSLLLNFNDMLNELNSVSVSDWNLDTFDFSDYNVSSPVKQLGEEDIKKSESVGAVMGGVIGAVYCHYKQYGTLMSAACGYAGGFAGAQIGQLVGTGIAIRRFQYASEYEFLESEIEASEGAIKTREAQLEEADVEIAKLEAEAANLSASAELTDKEIASVKALKKSLNKKLEENTLLESRYSDSIAYLDEAIETSEIKIREGVEEEAKTKDRLVQLKSNRDNLNQKLAKTRNHTDRMRGILQTVS